MALPRILALRQEWSQTDEAGTNITNVDSEFGQPRDLNVGLYDNLFKNSPKRYIVSSSPKCFAAIHKEDFTENFYISDEELEAYAQGVLDILTTENIGAVEIQQDEEAQVDLDDIALDDKDIKLSLYRSFKSIYDKWISNSGKSTEKQPTKGYFFNNYGQDDDRTLFDHFKFINRVNTDIGGQAIIDPAILSEFISTNNGKGPTESLYTALGNILSKNNFDFWPTPANIPLTINSLPDEDLKKMFTALDNYEKIQAGPIFNCVFTGGNSRQLKDLNNKEGGCELINSDYGDDSFDVTDITDWPQDFKENNDSGTVVFKVRYGQEAQNHFTALQVDQTDFKETQESLLIIDKLANPKQGNSPSQAGKGNSLYDVYLTRAYNCTVTGLGNMSIQPLMYFKLENVPMFRGTYLINNVKHKITAHKVETEFTGLRQPKVTIPIVEDPVSLLDLALSEEAIEGERQKSLGEFVATNNVMYNSDGEPFIPNKGKVDLSTIKGANSAYVINVKSPGNAGSKKQTPGNKCRKPSPQLEKLPYYDANDTFDIVGTKVPSDLFAKEINAIPGLSTLEKRIVYSVARKEQGSPVKCFGNNCFGFNVEGNFSGMDTLVNEGRVLNTFCWVDSKKDRVFPQFSSYKDSVEIFAKNQVRQRWIDLTFGGYKWWNGGNSIYKQILANAPAELNLYGANKDGSLINGMKETDSEKVLAAKFVIAYYWNWNSNSDKGEIVASVKSLENPQQTSKTKGLFSIWNESAQFFS